MKKLLIIKLVMFILTLIMFISSLVFAWTALIKTSDPLMIYSGRIDTIARLYQLYDPDHDGEDENNQYYELTTAVTFNQVIPGEIYSFKLEIRNIGTVPAMLSVDLVLDESSDLSLIEHVHLVYGTPVSLSQPLTYNMLLFNEIYIDPYEVYVFYFQVAIQSTLGNLHQNEQFVIKHLHIRLDQIQTP